MDFCRPSALHVWTFVGLSSRVSVYLNLSIHGLKTIRVDSDSGDQDHILGLQFSRFHTICTRRPSVHSLGLLVVFQRKGPCGDCSSKLPDARSSWLPDYICRPATLEYRTICRPATLNFRTFCRPATLNFRTICRPFSRFWTICRPASAWSTL